MTLRTPARWSAAVAAALCLGAAGAGAAHADTSPTSYLGGAFISPAVLAPGTAGKTVNYAVEGQATTPTTFSGITVAYDVSGLEGVAALTPQTGACTTSGTVVTCKVGGITTAEKYGTVNSPLGYTGQRNLPLTLVPAAGAEAGATGTVGVTVTGTSPVASSTTTRFSVSLADGPDLVVKGGGLTANKTVSAAAASSISRAVTFTNDGDQPAEGVTVEIYSGGYGLDMPEIHKNCRYFPTEPQAAFCYIPDLVEPGATETLSPAVKLLTTTDLMWQSLGITVLPGYQTQSGGYTVGAGSAFTLKDSTGAAQVPVSGQTAQNDIDVDDNVLDLFVTVPGSSADIAAGGSVAPSATADEYELDATLSNNGPGHIAFGRSGEYNLTADISFPEGVDAVAVPSPWIPVVDGSPEWSLAGQPGYSEYETGGGGIDVPEGTTVDLLNGGTLTVQAEPGFAGGSVSVTAGIDYEPISSFTAFGDVDGNPSNDTALLPIPAYSGS